MGRREVEKAVDPQQLREAIGRHFRRLTNTAGVNMAEFRAQLHEEEMVELLVGFTRDMTATMPFRRQCALDVLQLARGQIRPWIHDGETIQPDAVGLSGRPVREEIDSARRAAEVYAELDDLVRRKVHPSEWPEAVRLAAGDAISFFAEEESVNHAVP